MAKMETSEWLEWICSSEDAEALRNNYDQWAENYDDDVSNAWNPVTIAAASMLSTCLTDKQGKILDVGAGTGLAGLALHALGFSNITGIDISAAMLEQAAAKNVYNNLICSAISEVAAEDMNEADGIIATGVFAETHAGKTELEILAQAIKHGGIFVFTARNSFLKTISDVVDQPEWQLVESRLMPIYDDPIHLRAYKIHTPSA
ncbi:MAG: Unknown protein [uncultured Thiotrichaceae bacterium]|uniref:Methyltransferase type 11 domain-containing protein n=1 Tax=uncultured Thiotrichaceae bacterium TaxID=298394 RepID=A0A6S6U1B6_9GAMM|nr:MAG: Unknown protein [uncultured Thiotrichaceae bacterium]